MRSGLTATYELKAANPTTSMSFPECIFRMTLFQTSRLATLTQSTLRTARGGSSTGLRSLSKMSGDSVFIGDIVWLWKSGITAGCTTTRYCPEEPVTRGQMAALLSRALDLPAAEDQGFTDAAGSVFGGDINRLANAGITKGCTEALFCPDQLITRGQMAAFFVRAFGLPPAQSVFTDTSSSVFGSDIDRFAGAGLTTGCSADRFCPEDPVTRGQMAAFLRRASALPGWPGLTWGLVQPR
jgi:hypothetical protein